MAGTTRTERDTFGPIEVPATRYWAAQTQRSLENFRIGTETMPESLIAALLLIKRSAALVNRDLALLATPLADAIIAAADEILGGGLAHEFPLSVWQTGSGTQTNMNVNEVLANRANEMLGHALGGKGPVHPNDHVNLGQSSNDTFPTAMHVSAARDIAVSLLPKLAALAGTLEERAADFADMIKTGRTHLQDATPVTLGQEFSGYAAQLHLGIARIEATLPGLHALAQGGTAVGTGLNTHPEFSARIAAELARRTGLPFRPADNLFEALASHDAIAFSHGALTALAAGLFKIASDIRLMGSGPRAGLGEIALPENEPGSSIMPGKVNPTQAEALTMVCARVMGNGATISFAASQGHFELNVFKPVIADAMLQSIRLLGDAAESFRLHCVEGIVPNRVRLAEQMGRSLMLVTALTPEIGYDRAARIAKAAHANGTTLREEALAAGVDAATFDRLVDPARMLRPEA
ncbi:MAG: class II fumarate hydratase [Hyphomicrobiales bacterium]|jgi:fumarate hydratase, class II|nr:class II fumarate hydratase [Hyphomicrobiales bacterium]